MYRGNRLSFQRFVGVTALFLSIWICLCKADVPLGIGAVLILIEGYIGYNIYKYVRGNPDEAVDHLFLAVSVVALICICIKRLFTKIFDYAWTNDNMFIIDIIQTNLKCCGYNGPQDYNSDVPSSCFINNDNVTFTKGCYNIF